MQRKSFTLEKHMIYFTIEIYQKPFAIEMHWKSFKMYFHHTTCESTCDTLSSSAANQGDNTVSVAQGGTATPRATKQLLPPDRVFKKYISIYTPDQLKQTLHWTFVHLHFSAVSDLKMRLLSAVDVIATVS